MERFRRYLKGDISLWGVILFFALLSFLPVYSSSSNLVYLERTGISTRGYLIRHVGLIAAGLLIIYLIHRFPYRYFRPLARLGLLLSWILLFFALAMQCISTFAIVRKETNSWKWAIIQWLFMTGFAYLSAFMAYQLLS